VREVVNVDAIVAGIQVKIETRCEAKNGAIGSKKAKNDLALAASPNVFFRLTHASQTLLVERIICKWSAQLRWAKKRPYTPNFTC
jgi:hypothetical protein